MDVFIADRFCKFFAVRAEIFEILRKKPVEVRNRYSSCVYVYVWREEFS